MESIWEYKRYVPFIGILYCQTLVWGVAGEYCSKVESGHTKYIECDYGCCGSSTDRSCCSISTAVLIVACVIGGLVVVAMLAAIIVCCYKKYKDKRESRVRQLRQEQADQQVLRRNVSLPKPPTYVSAPPAYSETMPDSHYRPPTVTGRTTPSNMRYDGRRHQFHNQGGPTARGSEQFSRHFVAMTHTSGTIPPGNSFQANNNNIQRSGGTTLPGSAITEPPPAYTEFIRGQTPANRRQPANRQPTLPEESETPSSITQTDTRTPPQYQSYNAEPGLTLLPVPTQSSGQPNRSTRVNSQGTQRHQTDDSGIETLTIV